MLCVIFYGMERQGSNKTSLGIVIGNTKYIMYDVPSTIRIDDFVRSKGYEYRVGCGYYLFEKEEIIRPDRSYIEVDSFISPSKLVVSSVNVTSPTKMRPYEIGKTGMVYMQSASSNRKLLAGTRLILNTSILSRVETINELLHRRR